MRCRLCGPMSDVPGPSAPTSFPYSCCPGPAKSMQVVGVDQHIPTPGACAASSISFNPSESTKPRHAETSAT